VELPELLGYVAQVLERLHIDYAVVGSFASTAWGEPRFTLDVDIVVRLRPQHIEPLLAAFPADESYMSKSAVEEVVRLARPFNVIHFESGGKVAFMVVGDSPWAIAQINRRRKLEFTTGMQCFVAAPEDVIIGKLIYYHEGESEKHLRDITGIFQRAGAAVDLD
jgi:hypothetical protein